MSRFEQAALDLAERGFHPFAVKARSKFPVAGSQGWKDGTRDERQLLMMWDAHPDRNVALACQPSGFWAFDVDPKHGGDPDEFAERFGLHDYPCMVETGEAPEPDDENPHSLAGQRGRQYYFRGHRKGHKAPGGCEVRGDGHFVVCPPSVHPSGVEYRWLAGPVDPNRLPEAPAELVAFLDEVVDGTEAGTAQPVPDKISYGHQHNALVSLAGSMRRRGMDAEEIEAALLVTNAKRLERPAPAENISRIAHSVTRYAPQDVPWQQNGAGEPPNSDGQRFSITCLTRENFRSTR